LTTTDNIRPASTVMLLRESGGPMQVLMVRRNQQIDFISGSMVFPGGKVDPSDLAPEWENLAGGWSTVPESERGPRVAAARELFEESGVLMAEGAEIRDDGVTLAARKAIEAGSLRFSNYLAERGLRIDLEAFTLFSRWLTPPVMPKRFDTYFYLAAAPAGQVAVSDGRETVETEWIEPGLALELAARKQRSIVFPTRMNLGLLSATPTMAGAVSAAAAREHRVVTPSLEVRNGQRFLTLAPDLGYGAVEEPLDFLGTPT